ncbi:hypothetical protein NDU88_002457 [Pleurodeles waltl]|uniref:Uncharacterized protein n=1 Tax=Pleurodeles waltl TaxID=8319 RepID=A0AAV7U9S6_PLEWA|nr:hypothetical protein NDU88_002457 [Pleurodeles waltl]
MNSETFTERTASAEKELHWAWKHDIGDDCTAAAAKGFLLAKRLITRKWRSPDPPSYEAWVQSLTVWARAECTVLRHEDVLGLCKYPLTSQWELMLMDLYIPLVPAPLSSDSPAAGGECP